MWQLENSLDDARNDQQELLNDFTRKLYVCDHPDTLHGYECDYCHEFVPAPEEDRDWDDRSAIYPADCRPATPEYRHWIDARYATERIYRGNLRWPLP